MRSRIVSVLASLLIASPGLLAQTIVGGWTSADGFTVLTFTSGGTYYNLEIGTADAGGGPGMERGSYTFNGSSLATTVQEETNGDWGVGTGSLSASLAGDVLTLDGSFVMNRVTSNTSLLVGSWISSDNLSVLTFTADGKYYDVEMGATPGDDGDQGIEFGTYSYVSGTLSITVTNDLNGDWGLGTTSGTPVVTATDLTFDSIELTRIGLTAVPEPSAFAIVGGSLALGFAALRRRGAWQRV